MAIDFHSPENRFTYASRGAAADWSELIGRIADPMGARVIDVGCGGGVYSRAWAELGASEVVGVDFSGEMIAGARQRSHGYANVSFHKGSADATGLADGCADIVFARALIHHLPDLARCFAEAHRLLCPGGLYLVQERTPEDVRLPGSPEHIRGYFFECCPELLEIELGRRPTGDAVMTALREAGFSDLEARTVRETRRSYKNVGELAADLRARTGRSILHELSDERLERLVAYIRERIPTDRPWIEREPWTLWSARRRRGA